MGKQVEVPELICCHATATMRPWVAIREHVVAFGLWLALPRTSLLSCYGKEFDAIPTVLLGRIHADIGFVKPTPSECGSGKSRLSPC